MDIKQTLAFLKNPSVQALAADAPPTEQTTNTANDPNNGSPNDTRPTTGQEFSTFLTLLTAQIKNQDPLTPLDSTQFVQQLATFSNLELQAKGNKTLELISSLLARQTELLTPQNNQKTSSIQTKL